MVNLERKHLREYAMNLLIIAALVIIVAGIYFHGIQPLMPIAALLLALRIFLTSTDANVRRLSGSISFYFGASTLSNIGWYLIPAIVDSDLVQSANYYYVSGMFWLLGDVVIIAVLLHMKNSRQWYIDRRLDRLITAVAVIGFFLVTLLVFLNIRWDGAHVIDILILLFYLCFDIVILTTSLKLLQMNLKRNLRILVSSVMLFFGINMLGDLLFECRWLFKLKSLASFNIVGQQWSVSVKNATDLIYEVALLLMAGYLFLYLIYPFRRRALDEARRRLKDTQLFVDDLVAKSPDATCIFSRDGRLLLVNDSFLHTLGLERKNLSNTYNLFSDFCEMISDNRVSGQISNLRNGETVIIPEVKISGIKDGRKGEFFIYLKIFPTYGSDGRIVNYVLIIEDITERTLAEKALAFERSQLLSIFESIDDNVYVTDPHTHEVLYANNAMKERFGGDLVGGVCYREFQRRDSPCDFCTNSIILKEKGKPYRWEYYNPMVERYFLITDRIIKWPDGRDVRFEIARDITERRWAEEALRESEEKFRALAESSQTGILLIQGEDIAYINNSLAGMLGYTLEEVARIKYWDVAPQEMKDYIRERGNLRQKGLPGPSRNELMLIAKNGHHVWLDCTAAVITYRKMPAMLLTAVDITERKQYEEALRESEEKFRALTEMAPVAICILQDGLFKYANPSMETITGYGKEELLKINFMDMVHPAALKYIEGRYSEWLGGDGIGEFRSVLMGVRKDRKICWVDLSRKNIEYDGRPALLITGVDITERKQYEDALRESEEKYRSLVENINDMVWETDTDGKCTYASPKARDLLGDEPEDVLGKTPFQYMVPEDIGRVKEMIEPLLARHEPFGLIEYTVVHYDGTLVNIEANGVPMFDRNGRFRGYKGVNRDITERKKAEEALRESEEKFRVLAETSPVAIIISQGESLIYVNHAAELQTGYAREEILAMKSRAFMHPDNSKSIEEKYALGIQGVPQVDRNDVKIMTRDGRELWMSVSTTATTYMKKPALMAICMDITERKKAEEALRESEASLAKAQTIAHIGNWEWDIRNSRGRWSDELYNIFGLDKNSFDPSQENFLSRVHPEDRARVESAIIATYNDGRPYKLDFRIIRPDGSERTLYCEGELAYDKDNKPIKIFGINQDITDRVRLEKELFDAYDSLKEEYKRKTDFTNAAAHELRTPLTPIIGYTDILKSEVKDERHRKYLEIIERNAIRQKNMVNRMLELASLDAGMAHVNNSEFLVLPLVTEIADNYRTVNPDILVDVPEGLRVISDSDVFRHVLDNLVSNAVKYNANGRRIEIRAVDKDDHYLISVKDQGAGIPREEWSRIFERFYIVGGDRDNRTSGRIGLGLALVKAYVNLIGGMVWLESEPEKGSTFFFTVPKVNQPAGEAANV